MSIAVKICGLTRAEDTAAAVGAGADFVGVVFFQASPRFVMPAQAATILNGLSENVGKVGLFVNPQDVWLAEVVTRVPLDMIQLHGGESVERVKAIRQTFGLPVMKAVTLRTAADLDVVPDYLEAADWLLFDARAPAGADRPGGHGIAFDWKVLQVQAHGQAQWPIPWMLAGGLTPINVAEALRCTGTTAVDVSSGVEERPGVKSAMKIHAFLDVVRKTTLT